MSKNVCSIYKYTVGMLYAEVANEVYIYAWHLDIRIQRERNRQHERWTSLKGQQMR